MNKLTILLISLLISSIAFSQAEEVAEDGYRKYNVILMVKGGQVENVFKEGMGITVKIEGKTVSGSWYYNAEPDVVTVVGRKGEVLGKVKLNDQKMVKLETDEPKKSGGGVSIGIGIGPIGVSSGGVRGGPRYISYNMGKTKAIFDKKIETREDKIKREYQEKMILEERRKAAEKQAKKDKRKKK